MTDIAERSARGPETMLRLALVPPLGQPRLSARERRMLELMADGHSTREVARLMCYSERTIKNVLQELMAREQLRNRTHAVAWAVRTGRIS